MCDEVHVKAQCVRACRCRRTTEVSMLERNLYAIKFARCARPHRRHVPVGSAQRGCVSINITTYTEALLCEDREDIDCVLGAVPTPHLKLRPTFLQSPQALWARSARKRLHLPLTNASRPPCDVRGK